jgi:hypothetical protein
MKDVEVISKQFLTTKMFFISINIFSIIFSSEIFQFENSIIWDFRESDPKIDK